LTSGLFHDEPTIEVLDQIGLDLSSVGNHEFDRGRTELLRLQHGGCFAPGADGGKVGVDTCMNAGQFRGAQFQYLAANVVDIQSGKTLLPAYAIRAVDGIKLGFIGLTLKATPTVVTPSGVEGLRFEDEVATENRLVPVLRAQGVTVFVVLIHQGGETRATTVMDKSCPEFSGAIVDLADRMDPAIDVIVSGHTHQEYVCTRPDGKLITQTGSYGRLVSKIDLTVNAATGRLMAKDASNYPVINDIGVAYPPGTEPALPERYAALPKDPAVEAIVARYGGLTAPMTDAVVGRLAAPLDRNRTPAGESGVGALVADIFLAATSADIAFTNPGGVRSDLAQTSVTFGQLYNVLPFNNQLVSLDLTGEQLLRLLEQQWERPQPAGGRILPVSGGFTYTWDASQPEGAAPGTGRRVVPGSMRLRGEPVDMARTYRVTVNSFMAGGGDLFSVLKAGTRVQTGETDVVAAQLYFRLKGVVAVPSGNRIVRLH